MSVFLDTSGNASLAIGVCARCGFKFPIGELAPDPTYPGLLCCADDLDEYDPYLLPARTPESITLRYARPDLDIIAPLDPTYPPGSYPPNAGPAVPTPQPPAPPTYLNALVTDSGQFLETDSGVYISI